MNTCKIKIHNIDKKVCVLLLVMLFAVSPLLLIGQTNRPLRTPPPVVQKKSEPFWDHVRYGGNFGLTFGNQFTDILIAPNILYEFNPYFVMGFGTQFNYLQEKNRYETYVYGGSIIAIANPLEFLQISLELEQLRFEVNNRDFQDDAFWNTALFAGIGIRERNFTVGIRYNLLHINRNGYYSEPLIPFVRVSF